MTKNQVLETVIRLLKNEVNLAHVSQQLSLKDRLREDLQLDSLQIVALSISIEDEFDLIFDPLEMDLIKIFATVDSLVDFLYCYVHNKT